MEGGIVNPKSETVEPKEPPRRIVSLSGGVVAVAIVLGFFVAWSYSFLSGMQNRIDELSDALTSAKTRNAVLAEQIATHQKSLVDVVAFVNSVQSENISDLEKQYIVAASARLEETVTREIAALGTSGFRFNMVEFDRRTCALGGTFTGEHPDGYQQDEPFDPNNFVEVQASTEDVRGIPFYRVTINGNAVQWQGSPAIFRHGRMRIECN